MIQFGADNALPTAPFLMGVEAGPEQTVRFRIALGITGAPEAHTGPLGEVLAQATPVVPGQMLEISFAQVLLHMVREESFAAGRASGRGEYFVLYDPSPLTPLLEMELAEALRGPCRHYGILCQNHVVDVVTTGEPVVTYTGSRSAYVQRLLQKAPE